ncbi:transmembrane amino acid transporter protein-domain-containing protein [Cunninghamella echinulata]|nr:transmembrane amino acid transporter protein-domain-containing protein [Cunninghamella echinulata]
MDNSNHKRIPYNSHPEYGTVSYSFDDSLVPDLTLGNIESHTAPLSRTQTFRTAVESMAESCSRASMMYFAENLHITPSNQQYNINNHFMEDNHDYYYDQLSKAQLSHIMHPTLDTLNRTQSEPTGGGSLQGLFPNLSRPTTVASLISQPLTTLRSSFTQSIFNALNVLIGIGILTLPYAFRLAGWSVGSIILLFCCLSTNYTAKVLIRCLNAQPIDGEAVTYSDIGAIAFGDRGRTFIGGVFILELITIGIAMVILLGDAIQSLYPSVTMVSSRLISFIILLPTLFFPIRKLSYASFIGILSCIFLLFIVLYDGISKPNYPGSLWEMAPTEVFPSNLYSLPISFGLIMSGFAGHAVFPSIYRDMDEPKKYNKVVDISYIITILIYVSMAWAGYSMFGMETMKEITQNLAVNVGYNRLLNNIILWLVFLTPIAKYGVMMNPLQMVWEHWLLSKVQSHCWSPTSKNLFTWSNKIILHSTIVFIAIIFPGFDRVMSLLGALFSYGISVIFPLVCHLKLFGHSLSTRKYILDWVILSISCTIAIIGTIWSFLPT